MLFHSLSGDQSGIDIEQIVINLPESVDPGALGTAWQRVIQRHAVLRTSFEWEEHDEPLQLVHAVVPLSITCECWSDLSAEVQEAKTKEYLLAERRRGFDLRQPPLMRLSLIQ